MDVLKSFNVYENNTLRSIILSKLQLVKITNEQTDTTHEQYNISIFKKIKYCIDVLNNTIKFLIIQTNNDKFIKDIKVLKEY